MINFKKELAKILDDDPLGLLVTKPSNSSSVTTDDRLVASFIEINDFFAKHGKEPNESTDIGERKLFSRLQGIRSNPEKIKMLKEHDKSNLLKVPAISETPKLETVDDIFKHDTLGLLEGSDPADIFKLRNVKSPPTRTEKTASRKPCKNFAQFEPIFIQAHADLAQKKKRLIPFESELQVKKGEIFVLQGLLVYIAKAGERERKNFGNFNARLHCVFENGTESHMLLRSLAAAFWKDGKGRQLVEATDREIFNDSQQVTNDDKTTGYIYVLKSMSTDPKVREIPDLYKIGYSRLSVEERIAKADQEATYLMSEVRLVTQFQVFNVDPQKFENLIHRFFGNACLSVDIFDGSRNRYSPREWFVVPLHIIETAIKLIVNGEIVNYRYDADEQSIEVRDK